MLSVLALQLWEQKPNICPLLTVLHDGQEGTLENLQAIRLRWENKEREQC